MHRTHGSSRAVSRIAPSVIAVGALQLLLVIARCWSTREAPTAGDALMVLLACVVTAAALGYRERRQGTRLERSEAPAEPLAASWRPALLLGLIPLASWAAMYLAFGPFVSMNDTFYIIQNPIGQASGHPIVYSLVVSAFLRGGGTGSFVALAALQMALFYGMVAGRCGCST